MVVPTGMPLSVCELVVLSVQVVVALLTQRAAGGHEIDVAGVANVSA
jgi:hypothetical protein